MATTTFCFGDGAVPSSSDHKGLGRRPHGGGDAGHAATRPTKRQRTSLDDLATGTVFAVVDASRICKHDATACAGDRIQVSLDHALASALAQCLERSGDAAYHVRPWGQQHGDVGERGGLSRIVGRETRPYLGPSCDKGTSPGSPGAACGGRNSDRSNDGEHEKGSRGSDGEPRASDIRWMWCLHRARILQRQAVRAMRTGGSGVCRTLAERGDRLPLRFCGPTTKDRVRARDRTLVFGPRDAIEILRHIEADHNETDLAPYIGGMIAQIDILVRLNFANPPTHNDGDTIGEDDRSHPPSTTVVDQNVRSQMAATAAVDERLYYQFLGRLRRATFDAFYGSADRPCLGAA